MRWAVQLSEVPLLHKPTPPRAVAGPGLVDKAMASSVLSPSVCPKPQHPLLRSGVYAHSPAASGPFQRFTEENIPSLLPCPLTSVPWHKHVNLKHRKL